MNWPPRAGSRPVMRWRLASPCVCSLHAITNIRHSFACIHHVMLNMSLAWKPNASFMRHRHAHTKMRNLANCSSICMCMQKQFSCKKNALEYVCVSVCMYIYTHTDTQKAIYVHIYSDYSTNLGLLGHPWSYFPKHRTSSGHCDAPDSWLAGACQTQEFMCGAVWVRHMECCCVWHQG